MSEVETAGVAVAPANVEERLVFDVAVSYRELRDALERVKLSVGFRSTLPVLDAVLIELVTSEDAGSQIRVRTNNLDVAAQATVDAVGAVESLADGGLGVQVKDIAALFKAAGRPEDRVRLVAKSRGLPGSEPTLWLGVIIGERRVRLPGLNAAEFPVWPGQIVEDSTVDLVWQAPIAGETFRDAVGRTLFARSTEESRPILNGVALSPRGENGLYMTATNGHRMVDVRLDAGNYAAFDGSVIFSVGSLRLAAADKSAAHYAVSVFRKRYVNRDKQTGHQACLIRVAHVRSARNVELWTREIEGPYPDVTKVFPKEATRTLTISSTTLARVVDQALIHASASTKRGILILGEDCRLRSGVTGGTVTDIQLLGAKFDGAPITIGVNLAYVKELLKFGGFGGDIVLEMSDPGLAIGVRSVDAPSDQARALVMPLRVLDGENDGLQVPPLDAEWVSAQPAAPAKLTPVSIDDLPRFEVTRSFSVRASDLTTAETIIDALLVGRIARECPQIEVAP